MRLIKNSVTLVDANVVIYVHEQGLFSQLVQGNRLGVTPEVVREAAYFKDAQGSRVPITLVPFFNSGHLQLEHASVNEIQTFTAACPCAGLGAGETESLSIVLSRGCMFCTGDKRAMKVMNLMGLRSCWCSLEDLYTNCSLNCAQLDTRWHATAWP
jgi:hypothetical protein